MARTKSSSTKIREISSGIFSAATDYILFLLSFGFEVALGGTSSLRLSGINRAATRALDALEDFPAKKVVAQLNRRGLIEVKKNGVDVRITEAGRRRLVSLLPIYDSKRIWDGRIYIVTYDIPVAQNKHRNTLRAFIKRIGCGMLQESVWITPYNPSILIGEFIHERGTYGTIIVSSLGKDGAIGGSNIQEVLVKVYNLEELSSRYEDFVEKYGDGGDNAEVACTYFSILREDPQLPFRLLPPWWKGDEAYDLFCRFCRDVSYDISAMHVHR